VFALLETAGHVDLEAKSHIGSEKRPVYPSGARRLEDGLLEWRSAGLPTATAAIGSAD
jgi:hypothetical protein